MVSQNDVAKRAGVSNAVVSYVINNGPRKTSPETRKKVLKAIKELGYRKNNVARSLKTNTSNVIGLIIPDSSNAFFSEVAKGIEDEAYQQGYTLMFGNSSSNLDRQENYIETFISQLVDGIIFLTTPLPEEHQSLVQINDTPVVVIDPEFPYLEDQPPNLYMVAADSEKGGFAVGEYLAGKGHHRMAIIAGKEEVPPGSYRVEGFLSALHEADLDAQVIWAGEHAEDGFKAATALLNSPTPPTAIFACNDLLAMGVLRAACDLGVQVPEQLAVVGFDDIDMASYTCPRLTTVRQPKYEMGQVAAKFLINKIKSEKETGAGPNPADDTALVKLDTELIIRESA